MYTASKDCFQNRYWLPTARACSAQRKKLLVPASHLFLCRAALQYFWLQSRERSAMKLSQTVSPAPSSRKFASNPVPSLWLKPTSVPNLQKNYQKNLITPTSLSPVLFQRQMLCIIVSSMPLKKGISMGWKWHKEWRKKWSRKWQSKGECTALLKDFSLCYFYCHFQIKPGTIQMKHMSICGHQFCICY